MSAPLRPLDVALRGVALIEASAGTGKTFTLTTLYLRLLLEEHLRPGEIVVVTYTNAATAELRTRVRSRLLAAVAAFHGQRPQLDDDLALLIERRRSGGTAGDDERRLAAALYSFDDAAIFTVHGFCQRVLQDHAFESGVGFAVRLVTDQRSLVREIVRDFWARELYAAPRSFAGYVRSLSTGRSDPIEDLVSLALLAVAQPDMPVWSAAQGDRPSIRPLGRRGLLGTNGSGINPIVPSAPSGSEARIEGPAVEANSSAPPSDLERYVALQLALVDHVRTELLRRKEEANVQYFDDLLTRLRDALAGPRGEPLAATIRERYRAALIDEFQDTDPVQYDIFRRIYAGTGHPLFLIGDPKQAIYSFRGADVFTYMDAKRHAEVSHTLGVNRRSDPRLLRALNSIFSRARCPFLLAEIPFEDAEPPPGAADRLGGAWAGRAPLQILYVRGGSARINKGSGAERVAAATAGDVARFLGSGAIVDGEPARPDHIAILCRTNVQAHQMQEELRRLGIPSVLQTDASVFETGEAAELERILRAMADPADSAGIIAALCTPLLAVGAAEILAMREGTAAWDEWTDRFHRLHEAWRAGGLMPALRALFEECGIAERVLGATGGERRMTNLLHLAEIVQTAEGEAHRGPLAVAEWFAEMHASREARQDQIEGEAAQIRLESDDRALKLVTIHKAKGLEYPIVYCPFSWDGKLLRANDSKWMRFHDPLNEDRLTLDIGPDPDPEHKRRAEHEALAESLRLLYVALTRARHRCVVVWGLFRDCETSALGYLLHQAPAAEPVEEATKQRLKSLSDEEMIAELERLTAAAEGTIEVSELDESPAPRHRPAADAGTDLTCPPLARVLRSTWRTSSFSALVAGGEPLSHQAEEGIDRDESAGSGMVVAPAPGAPVPLADFPSGTRAGLLVHAVFENLDFRATPMEVRAVVSEQLSAFAFDPVWCDPLARAIVDVLATPVGNGNRRFALNVVPPQSRLNELEFLFPVLDDGAEGGFRSDDLAAVFARHAGEVPGRAYVERLRRLGFAPLAGFLKGFLDLAFEHRGRWYVVDYKSNHLGPLSRHYTPQALEAAMAQHHYYLQYHLYTVALHRYLSLRLDGYDYERHVGGVFYLFVRGMAPSYPPGNGVFFDRPSRALIESLSEALGG